jgi:MoaA/NifB/PqqE/SkfB family radical SAM enzyme
MLKPSYTPRNWITNDKPDSFSVAWELTTTCNYACWYCPPELHDGKYKWPDLATSIDFFASLAAIKDSIHLDMVGGEPTLWPELDDFLTAKPQNMTIEISTNGSRTVNWWRKNIANIECVTLTVHPDTADMDHVYRVCEEITQHGIQVHVFLMAISSKMDQCQDLHDRLKASGFKMSLNTKVLEGRIADQLGNHDMVEVNNSDDRIKRALLNNKFSRTGTWYPNKPRDAYLNGEHFNHQLSPMHGANVFTGWTCSAGQSRLFVRPNGDVYRGSCRNGGVIANMYKTAAASAVIGIGTTVCDRHACGCIDEIAIEKHSAD